MDFEALRYFILVADQGSFTKASIRLNMTQPAVSRRIKRLEEEFETPLLYRHGRGVTLTEAGIRVKDVAEEAFAKLADLKDDLGAKGLVRGCVTLGLPPSLGASLSVPLARSFQKCFPDAQLKIVEGFSGTLFEWLESGKIDIGILYDARRSPTMLVTPILREDLFLVQSPNSHFGKGPVNTDELVRGNFALSNSSNGLRRVIDACVLKADIKMNVTLEVDSLSALKIIVEEGPERSILPMGAIYREVKDGRLVARPFEEPSLRALLVTATPLHQEITRLAKLTQELLSKQVTVALEQGRIAGSKAK